MKNYRKWRTQIRRAWRCDALLDVREEWRCSYAMLRKALPDVPFWADVETIRRAVYGLYVPSMTAKTVARMLQEFISAGLLCRYRWRGKTTWYFFSLDEDGDPVRPMRGDIPPARILDCHFSRLRARQRRGYGGVLVSSGAGGGVSEIKNVKPAAYLLAGWMN